MNDWHFAAVASWPARFTGRADAMFLSHWDAPGACLVVPLGPSEYICSRVPRHALGFSVSGQSTPHTTHPIVSVSFSLLIQKNGAMSPLSKPLNFLTISENWHRVGEHFSVTHEPTVREKGQCEVLWEAAELGSPCKWCFGSDQILNDLSDVQQVISLPELPSSAKWKWSQHTFSHRVGPATQWDYECKRISEVLYKWKVVSLLITQRTEAYLNDS